MTSHLADLLLNLHDRVPAVSLANVVEILALVDGVKPCVRLLLDSRDEGFVRSTLEARGLYCAASPKRLRVHASTALGDGYLEPAPEGDPDARVELMVAREQIAAERAASTQSGLVSPSLGLLLGYPHCCVAAQERQTGVPDWVRDLLVATPRAHIYPFGANRFAYLFSEHALGFDYYPCTLNCSRTVDIALSTRKVLVDHGLAAFADRAEAGMRAPILVLRGVLVRPARWWRTADAGTACQLAGADMRGWKVGRGAEDDPVWSSSTVERLPDGTIRFHRPDIGVLEVAEGDVDNRFLVFG